MGEGGDEKGKSRLCQSDASRYLLCVNGGFPKLIRDSVLRSIEHFSFAAPPPTPSLPNARCTVRNAHARLLYRRPPFFFLPVEFLLCSGYGGNGAGRCVIGPVAFSQGSCRCPRPCRIGPNAGGSISSWRGWKCRRRLASRDPDSGLARRFALAGSRGG